MSQLGTRERALAALILLFLAPRALGTAGWRQAAPELDWSEAVYRGLQMFSLNFTEPPGNIVPWELQVARFAEPAFTVVAFAATVSTQLRLIFRSLIARRAEQVTIIGYGVSGKAAAEQFRGTLPAARLVALDYSVNSADHHAARRHGIELIECDALDADARRSYAARSLNSTASCAQKMRTSVRSSDSRRSRAWLLRRALRSTSINR